MALAAIILGLFAYGGYKRQQRQVAALAEGNAAKERLTGHGCRRRHRQGHTDGQSAERFDAPRCAF